MFFYFLVHLFLGVMLFSCTILINTGNPGNTPFWVFTIGPRLWAFLMIASAAAIITTLVRYGIFWALATAGEIWLGMFVALMLPMPFKALLTISSPISVVAIFGDLWRFWYF